MICASSSCMTVEKKNFRLPPASAALAEPQRDQILNHLPSTVTTRRSQSPTRRSGPSQDGRARDITTETDGNKFFLASDAQQAARTPIPAQSKPAFFTAKSFSSNSKTPIATPELRRAESVNDVRARSLSRPAAKRTPTLRDVSPSRQTQCASRLRPATIPKLATASVQDSPSPFATVRPIASFPALPSPETSILQKPAEPLLERKKSSMSLHAGDRTSIKSSSDSVPIIKSPIKQRTRRPQDRHSDSYASLASTTDEPDVEQNPLTSPQSAASTSTSLSQQRADYFDHEPAQPAQTHRKIMDLEIRTTSLLAVNNQLERQSRRQAAEMKELRKKLSHALKYPNADAASPLVPEESDVDNHIVMEDLDADDDLQEVGISLLRAANLVDSSIRRALLLSEQLLHDAKKGLHYRPRESEFGLGVLRVLQNATPDISSQFDDDEERDRSRDESNLYVPGNILDDADISGLDLEQPP